MGAGICFYLFWVIFSLVGILLATAIPDLLSYHLDFSIIAIFVAMIIPMCKEKPVIAGVLTTCFSGFILKFFHVEGAILISGLLGMLIAVVAENRTGEK